jgi:hypothetical protein
MKTILYYSILFQLLVSGELNAQQNFDVNATDIAAGPGVLYAINGQNFSRERFSNLVDGSPFFNAEFLKGMITLESGKTVRNLSLKLNLLDGTVNFLNDKNEELEAVMPIREVVLKDFITNESFHFIHSKYLCNGSGKSWYRNIDSGAVSLYVNEVRVMTETKSYGSATLQQNILMDPSFVLVYGKECTKVKNAAELFAKLVVIDPEFQKKASGLKIKGKSEKELIALTKSFNSFRKAPAAE